MANTPRKTTPTALDRARAENAARAAQVKALEDRKASLMARARVEPDERKRASITQEIVRIDMALNRAG